MVFNEIQPPRQFVAWPSSRSAASARHTAHASIGSICRSCSLFSGRGTCLRWRLCACSVQPYCPCLLKLSVNSKYRYRSQKWSEFLRRKPSTTEMSPLASAQLNQINRRISRGIPLADPQHPHGQRFSPLNGSGHSRTGSSRPPRRRWATSASNRALACTVDNSLYALCIECDARRGGERERIAFASHVAAPPVFAGCCW